MSALAYFMFFTLMIAKKNRFVFNLHFFALDKHFPCGFPSIFLFLFPFSSPLFLLLFVFSFVYGMPICILFILQNCYLCLTLIYWCNWWSFIDTIVAFLPPYTCTHTMKLFSIFLFIFCIRNKFVYIFPCFKWNGMDFITICDPFGVFVIWGRCSMCGKTIEEKSNILRAGKGDSWRDWHWALLLGASPRSSEVSILGNRVTEGWDWEYFWAGITFAYSVKEGKYA